MANTGNTSSFIEKQQYGRKRKKRSSLNLGLATFIQPKIKTVKRQRKVLVLPNNINIKVKPLKQRRLKNIKI